MAKYQAYAEYKDSGVEWLGVVPSHWIITTLKRYCYVKGGFAFSSDAFIDTGYPVIRIGDIKTDGSINLENCKYIPESLAVNSRDYLVEKNQLLMAMTGATIGKAGLYTSNQPAFLNQRVGKFELLAQNMNYRYLWYILKTDGYQEYIKLTAFGGAQPNISDTAMVDYPATIPSFDEQTQIAKFLDHETAKIDHLIEKQQQLIELLKEKRQAVISHAVTKGLDPNVPMKDSGVEWLGEVPEHWKIIKGGYIGTLFGSESIQEDDVTDQGSLPFIKVSSLSAETFKLSNIDWFVSERRAKFCKAEKNYIVFPKRGAAIFTNKVNVIEVDSVIDPNLMGWKIGKQGITEYFALLLKTRGLDDIADVSTVPQINNKHIAPEKFPLPPLSEQCEIVKFVGMELTKFDEMISVHDKFHRTLILSGFCLLKIAKISL
ncbi:restriction endonuclease subunit S, partial [Acinetobacter baumannii]